MTGRSKPPRCVCVALAILSLLCLLEAAPAAHAQTARAVQVWPDRLLGVASAFLGGTGTRGTAPLLPFGTARAAEGETVHARTYLHFPLDAFPPGTDVRRAMLYVYVDASLGSGEGALGVYRVADPWDEGEWGHDPAGWPALSGSPAAIVTSAARETAAPAARGGPGRPLASYPPSALAEVTSTPGDSPLPTSTPGDSPLATPTVTATATATSAPTAAPQVTPTASPAPSVPTVALDEVEGAWLAWDVTALLRAWLAGEAPDHGLALAAASAPDAGPDEAGDRLLACWLAADDPTTRPYLVADTVVYPVTPTPVPTPIVILPAAGGKGGCAAAAVLFAGLSLLVLGLAARRGEGENTKAG